MPAAPAEPCPDVEVVFARGANGPPGVGHIGQDFVDTLRTHVGAKPLDVYPVNYPASMDFPTAVDGINDAGTHVESMAAACPKTKTVLGGYSQGAAVMGFFTASKVPDGLASLRCRSRCRRKSPTTSRRSPCPENRRTSS